jgi:hypothetical protein
MSIALELSKKEEAKSETAEENMVQKREDIIEILRVDT